MRSRHDGDLEAAEHTHLHSVHSLKDGGCDDSKLVSCRIPSDLDMALAGIEGASLICFVSVTVRVESSVAKAT